MSLKSRNNLGEINRTMLYLLGVGDRDDKATCIAGINKNETKLTSVSS